jgi:hypothetical protein
MRRKNPALPAVIQARIEHLQSRKAVVDDLILCLERYSTYRRPLRRRYLEKSGREKSESEKPDGQGAVRRIHGLV